MTQTWFITGASSGFGAAFARHALAQGHNVAVTARRLDKLQQIAALAPGHVLAREMDVTDPAQVKEAVQAAEDRFGGIDVLINNAGYGIVGAVEETPEAELRAVMETNFFGAVAVTQAALPMMRQRRRGAIVMMSSLGGQLSFGGFGPYSASKFALEGMTEALAQEIAPFGLKAMIVEPGAFRTDFADTALRHMPKIAAYGEIVGGTRDFASAMHGTQSGDPLKAAAAIEAALANETTPLRLPLGDDAVDAIRSHGEDLLAELTKWEPTARNVNLDLSETAA
ncbi:short-chain dehydrogenase/reductase [Jannaschia pagri]|uniref:Short-chain dehydrogenase/reductase n=1 Tax=Jannaschia pagri TaxID=2829797 RepID=A0ABQ4NRK8_9RHOB|nr:MULTISPECIES: oxidoreductase [unclassified Jannaschia]GIT93185.1 short-chain dehydrogenase/reductase [Jannaschia sp. AI_61]GIT97048.1 short-chain dehydrogenase/reductase [Jannaschia sp. AI_62]